MRVPRHVAPLLVLAAALGFAHFEIFRAGAREFVPFGNAAVETDVFGAADVTYQSWLAARHARTWPTPWRLFDTPHCAPATQTLTLGLPMLSLGLLGVPAALFTREPLLVYNLELVAWSATAALAMYTLVYAWTGRRAAALFAALLFAFHPVRLDNAMYPTEWDVTWTALALYFAERLFALGRWRDAAGLGLAGALQVATSFYPLVAATLLALPLGLWLLVRRVPLRVKPAQAALALACVALAALLVLGPYLEARGSERITARSAFFFLAWFGVLPGALSSLGWFLLTAALAGLVAPRRLTLAGVAGDPRPALLAGALGVALVCAGSTTAPALRQLGLPVPDFDPYSALARVLPGLDSIRVVARVSAGAHLAFCVLAGAGAAAALALAGRHARVAGAALVAGAWLACLGLPIQGARPWSLVQARPPQTSIDFFAALADQGDDGPMLELPLDYGEVEGFNVIAGPPRILLEAWHRRRTSACFGSYPDPGRRQLAALADALPDPEAARALHAQGFTTIVVHHPRSRPLVRLMGRFETAAAYPNSGLRLLRHGELLSAYALVAEP